LAIKSCTDVFLARNRTNESAFVTTISLSLAQRFFYITDMSEIAKFVNNGSMSITPAVAEKVLRQLPQWKLEFTQINAPKFPHLVDQLEFLADAVEDAVEGAYKEMPYAHKKMGIIPENVLELGRADDSSVVRAVLIQNEKAFAIYAGAQGVSWQKITSQP
jgi:hypothetical protein